MHTHRQPMGRAVQPSGSAWGREEFAVQKLTHTHTHTHTFTGVASMVGSSASGAVGYSCVSRECGRTNGRRRESVRVA